MKMRKFTRLFIVISIMLIAGTAYAYLHRSLSVDELKEKADLIVIATPQTKSQATGKNMILEGVKPDMAVLDMITNFKIKGTLKGKSKKETFTLLHYYYNYKDPPKVQKGGPVLRKYKTDEFYREYLMFLKDEGNGIYIPISGQKDPNYAIRLLSN